MAIIPGFKIQGNFPAFVSPEEALNFDELKLKLRDNKDQIKEILLKHGGLVFRGFPVSSASCFAQFIESLNFGNFVNYIGGDSPRDKVEKGVYTSTEAPPAIHIPLHQELSYIKYAPHHIYFFCEIEPQIGGSTIIADARQVYKSLDPKVIERFKAKGLTYISHYYYRSKIMEWVNRMQRSHKSWIEVFETNDKKDVERKCVENEFAWKWLSGDWIEIKQTRPAVIEHPQTKEVVWYNQAHLYDFSPRLLGWKRYAAAKLFYFRKSTRLHEITFADGDPISRKDLYHVLEVLNKSTVAFPWRKGDVMVLDNVLAMHGRAPFQGKRRILTALTS